MLMLPHQLQKTVAKKQRQRCFYHIILKPCERRKITKRRSAHHGKPYESDVFVYWYGRVAGPFPFGVETLKINKRWWFYCCSEKH